MKIQVKETQQPTTHNRKKKGGIKNLLSFDLLLKSMAYLLIAGVLLFFGIGKVSNTELSKQVFLLVFTLLGVGVWFVKGLSLGKFEVKLSLVHIFTLAFLLLASVSTFLSRWRWGSFWGAPQEAKENLLTFLLFGIGFFFITQIFNKKQMKGMVGVLAIAGLLVCVVSTLQIFGKFIIPLPFTQSTDFSPVGSIQAWNILMATLLPLMITAAFASEKKLIKLAFYLFGLLLTLGLVVTNYWTGWLITLVSSATLLVLTLWKSEERNPQSIIIPALLFSLAVSFGFLNIRIPGIVETPTTVAPSLQSTFNITRNMLNDSIKTWVTGWGPGTFKYGWSLHRNPSINQTIFWNTRFFRGGSEIIERMGTLGLAGGISFLLLTLSGLWIGMKALIKEQKDWIIPAALFGSYIALSVSKFFTTHNTALDFLWWILLAGIVVSYDLKKRRVTLEPNSKENFIFSFLGIVLLTSIIFLFYLGGVRYTAEAKYQEAMTAGNIDEIINKMQEAINLNPQQERFWRDLSTLYLLKAQQVGQQDLSPEEKGAQISNLISNAAVAGRRATDINPGNVANWETRAQTYQQILGSSKEAFDWAVRSYNEARGLEPNNPYLLVELGKVYLTQATIEEEQNEELFSQAEGHIKKAFQLKPDYSPASYQMAITYIAQGKNEEAIQTLENLKLMAPYILEYDPNQDPGLAFQLGVLYYNNENLEKAESELKRALKISPEYSNAKYFLGLVYSKQGRTEEALQELRKVSDLNPDNQEVKRVISNIQEGKDPFEGFEGREEETTPELPEELPIEEKPEEK